MQRTTVASVLALSLLTFVLPAAASADPVPLVRTVPAVEPVPRDPSPLFDRLELTLDVGWLSRATTGSGGDLLEYGYDHGGGVATGVDARLFFHQSSPYFRHGMGFRLGRTAGPLLGLTGGYAFATTQLDLTYVFRSELPCMSDEDLGWRASARVGLTGIHADAGTGRSSTRDDSFLGANLDLHSGIWLAGVGIDIRPYFAVGDGPVQRSFHASVLLRAGVELDVGPEAEVTYARGGRPSATPRARW